MPLFNRLYIDRAHRADALIHQALDQVPSDKASGSANNHALIR
jgi:hypothetical protein